VLDYDTDKLVPVYGFGAKPNKKTPDSSDLFPCSGNPEDCEGFGVKGIF
jgi:Copine